MLKFLKNYLRIKRRNTKNSFFYKLNIFYELFISEKIFIKKKTYSQFGEDKEILNFFKNKESTKVYVDIGAFHPTINSNTFLLYLNGWRGYNFDINKYSIDLFKVARPRDVNLNIGISNKIKKIKIKTTNYIHEQNSINPNYNSLISKEFLKKGLKLEKKLIQLSTISRQVKENFSFLNIDAEGEDLKILKSIDFKKFSPQLICVEILKKSEKKMFFQFLKSKKYYFFKNFDVSYLFKKN